MRRWQRVSGMPRFAPGPVSSGVGLNVCLLEFILFCHIELDPPFTFLPALGFMTLQYGFLARLTWWEYSWDLMEPVTYFIGSFNQIRTLWGLGGQPVGSI